MATKFGQKSQNCTDLRKKYNISRNFWRKSQGFGGHRIQICCSNFQAIKGNYHGNQILAKNKIVLQLHFNDLKNSKNQCKNLSVYNTV